MRDFFSVRINGDTYTQETLPGFCRKDSTEIWKSDIINFFKQWNNSETYIEVQTSGSTGIPKDIRLSRESMIFSAKATCTFFNITEKSNIFLCLPVSYIAGKMMLVRALVSGCQLWVQDPSSRPFKELTTDLDFAAVTPHQLLNSLIDLKSKKINNLIVGGSPVSAVLQQAVSELDTRIFETYGMTETCSHIALRPVNGPDASDSFKILPGIDIYPDHRGCLVIRTQYLSPKEIITNDMVEIIGKDQFRWMGRIDNVINSGGIKLHPEKIEEKISTLIPDRFFISALPDRLLGECVILVIEQPTKNNIDERSLRKELKSVLSTYELPKMIYFTDAFVISTSGKILKKETIRKITSLR